MSDIKALDKLRNSSHLDDDKWTLETGEIVIVSGSRPNDPNAVNWGEQWRKIADEIEAEIAERYQLLPVDADGVPIHVGDAITLPNGSRDDVRFITIRKYDTVFNERGWVPSQCTHVKTRTLEDVLADFAKDVAVSHSDFISIDGEKAYMLAAINETADEIRELLGGDAE